MASTIHKTRKYLPPMGGGSFAVAPRAWGVDFPFSIFAGDDVDEEPFTEEGEYAVVAIDGPLDQKASWWSDSYEAILSRVEAAFASDRPKVCLRLNSPGGIFAGAIELARDIRAIADVAGKPLVAFTDADMLSAAYAIGCAADEIVGTPSSQLGSVGVWGALLDVTAADAMLGMKFLVVASGTAKADRNPHMPMTKEAAERLRGQVDEQAATFIELVADRRDVSREILLGLEGAELAGGAAVTFGLADRVVNSWSSFLNPAKEPVVKAKSSKLELDEAKGILTSLSEEDSDDGNEAKKMLKALEAQEPKDEKGEQGAKNEKAEKDNANATLGRQVAELDRASAPSAVGAGGRKGAFQPRLTAGELDVLDRLARKPSEHATQRGSSLVMAEGAVSAEVASARIAELESQLAARGR